jgi:hypothetical protein
MTIVLVNLFHSSFGGANESGRIVAQPIHLYLSYTNPSPAATDPASDRCGAGEHQPRGPSSSAHDPGATAPAASLHLPRPGD